MGKPFCGKTVKRDFADFIFVDYQPFGTVMHACAINNVLLGINVRKTCTYSEKREPSKTYHINVCSDTHSKETSR